MYGGYGWSCQGLQFQGGQSTFSWVRYGTYILATDTFYWSNSSPYSVNVGARPTADGSGRYTTGYGTFCNGNQFRGFGGWLRSGVYNLQTNTFYLQFV